MRTTLSATLNGSSHQYRSIHRVRWVVLMCTPSNTWFLGPTQVCPHPQMVSQLAQPFLQGSQSLSTHTDTTTGHTMLPVAITISMLCRQCRLNCPHSNTFRLYTVQWGLSVHFTIVSTDCAYQENWPQLRIKDRSTMFPLPWPTTLILSKLWLWNMTQTHANNKGQRSGSSNWKQTDWTEFSTSPTNAVSIKSKAHAAHTHTHTHTHTRLTALFPGLPVWAGTRKVKPIWILLKQETVSGSGISWEHASLHLAPDR